MSAGPADSDSDGVSTSIDIHLRCGGLDGSLDGELQRHRRRRAAVAAAEQPEPDRAGLGDLEQLDVAAVRAEVRPHALQRLLDALLDPVRMQSVHDQKSGDQLVTGEAGEHFVIQPAGLVQDLHHPFES